MPVQSARADWLRSIAVSVVIHRPVAEVFAFYRDFRNLPQFLGDVVAVEPRGDDRSVWTIQAPFGLRLRWTVAVTDIAENRHIYYETVSDRLKTRWRISFAPWAGPDRTVVREVMLAPRGKLTRLVLAMLGKRPAAEVRSNLNRLRQLLETETSAAVPAIPEPT